MIFHTFFKVVFVFVSILTGIKARGEPHFIGTSTNITVVVGRDATLICKVENLYKYKVAWLRVDTQTILTIGTHVITKNHRVGVTRGDGQSWALTLKETREADGGQYMCQINTEPMITQTHYLQVVVPPDIVDTGSSGEVMAREGDDVSLHCAASGTPQPTITWRRENSSQMNMYGQLVHKWTGLWLNISHVKREMNGAFLCIATNGVPPSVSKRILLHVLCAPTVHPVSTMIGGYLQDTAQLHCDIEANPIPSVFWTHNNVSRIQNGSKYQVNVKSNGYRHTASLVVYNVSRENVGSYQCHVDNALGTAKADVVFFTLATTTSTSTTTTTKAPIITSTELSPTTEEEQRKHEIEDYVVVLSQHQMQNLDISPSL